jgi:hypothetical protein
VDYVVPFEGQLISVEVKSGADGKLKSLHMFMDLSTHNMAIRFYAGLLHITDAVTSQRKEIQTMNLPYYLVSQIENYPTWLKTQI